MYLKLGRYLRVILVVLFFTQPLYAQEKTKKSNIVNTFTVGFMQHFSALNKAKADQYMGGYIEGEFRFIDTYSAIIVGANIEGSIFYNQWNHLNNTPLWIFTPYIGYRIYLGTEYVYLGVNLSSSMGQRKTTLSVNPAFLFDKYFALSFDLGFQIPITHTLSLKASFNYEPLAFPSFINRTSLGYKIGLSFKL